MGNFNIATSGLFSLHYWDWMAIGAFVLILFVIGVVNGKKERNNAEDYFLAGRKLPWYVVGTSFIAANISSEHLIGMIGTSFIFGICTALFSWANIGAYTFMIWLFIPFLIASKVFTIPEFLERRFNPFTRQYFAVVTLITNIFAFLAAVLYGGTIAFQEVFDTEFWPTLIVMGVLAGSLAIYGGLSSSSWSSLPTVIIIVLGGFMVTIFGLNSLADEVGASGIVEGFKVMVERNQATSGQWKLAAETAAGHMPEQYNRMSVVLPVNHPIAPWINWFFIVFSVSIWYNALNQFMIQRVLGAKNGYHAKMGVILAGFLQAIMPVIITIPGLILFAMKPEIMTQEWTVVKTEADQGFIYLVKTLLPVGFAGLVLAALFGAIQSTVSAVVNSTSTVLTMDIYKRMFNKNATEKQLVRFGIISSFVILAISIVIAGFINSLNTSLFVYVQQFFAFFAPPFAAIFLLGILWKRINGKGASSTVVSGFVLGIILKTWELKADLPEYLTFYLPGNMPEWLLPFYNQAAVVWVFAMLVCVIVSLMTDPPAPEAVTDQLVFNWQKINIFTDLGDRWYKSIIFWWLLLVFVVLAMILAFSGLFF
ncbi:MAG: sodium/solute symporter [Flavobacteriaceae bacterium]